MVIAVYFGGARRGCVMMLASSTRDGWSLIQKELRNFLSSAKTPSSAGDSSDNSGRVGQTAGVVGMGIICLSMVTNGS